MASGARPLRALAQDGLLPRFLAKTGGQSGTPIAAIAVIAICNAVLVVGPFQSLVIIDVLLMVTSYALIFCAAVTLRITEPTLDRPFLIPGGLPALIALVFPALCLIAFMIWITLTDHSVTAWGLNRFELFGMHIGWYGLAGLLAILSGPLLYPIFRFKNQRT
jgi:amino acid transporter